MYQTLINTLSFVIVILVGYLLKQANILKEEDGQTLSKIILNLTLPATIIRGLNQAQLDTSILALFIVAVLANTILLIASRFLTRNKPSAEEASYIFSLGGYNIGNFVIPFVEALIPGAITYIVGFDMGNAVMNFGVIPAYGASRLDEAKSNPLKTALHKLATTPTFVTYAVMLVLRLLDVSLPAAVMAPIEVIANANGFLSMFMIGVFLRFSFPKADRPAMYKLLASKYILAIAMAALVYFFLPYNQNVRLIASICLVSPISTMGTIQMIQYGVKPAVSGYLSTLSILISIALTTLLLMALV